MKRRIIDAWLVLTGRAVAVRLGLELEPYPPGL
jgi:hypothetical protein